jgi:serine/threonine-protein kinase
MPLSSGARFGPYDVAEQIGSGGMGEVYRARDTTLGRDVAIKVLPASFSSDAMRVARFEQEAKTLASLNHTNIAHIYGLERSDGSTGIVMELVDGPTLVDRLAQGPMPVDEALRVADQVADALQAAHERGIVHRDLKPANVKVKPDGTVKVLDFGIAKALDPRFITGPGPAALTTPAMTEVGFILGTAAYMSPEQAKGKAVDQRTDVWAFGCVLYEMLTGEPAFLGEDVTSTLARVLEVPANLSALPSSAPPAVRRTLELCLQKDVRNRIADMRDVKLALAGRFAVGEPAAAAASRRALPIAASVVVAALLAGAVAWLLKPAPRPEPKILTRFDYAVPEGLTLATTFTSMLDIAPNGDLFAFNANDGIHIRRMADVEAPVVAGTAGAFDVALSPDGREAAYYRNLPNGQLVKVAIGGGAPVVLVNDVPAAFGLTWDPNGTIFFGQRDGIWRVSQNGGTPEQVVKLEPGAIIYGPQLLPGGEWLLFTHARSAGRWNEADIVVQSLATGERRVLRSGGHDARYLSTGHLIYTFQNDLFASTLDVRTLTLGEERVPLVQGVLESSGLLGGAAFYAVSSNGTLVFLPGTNQAETGGPQKSLVWVDREGKEQPVPVRPDNYTMARISPDGTRIALVIGSQLPATDPLPDIYVFDLTTENLTQLTFNTRSDDGPVWSRDGSRIFYRSYGEGGAAVYAISPDGGTPELVASGMGANPLPWSISADDSTLLLVDAPSLQDLNFSVLNVREKEQKAQPLLDLAEQVSEPSLSPNGQWMAYYNFTSTPATGEVNIRPFPDVRQQRRPVSPGIHPVFSPNGSEIFVFDGEGLSVAPVQYTPFRVGSPTKLFRGQYWWGASAPNGLGGRTWDVDPKNDRFLMVTLPRAAGGPAGPQAQPPFRVVLNWFEELNQRVPKR